MKAGTICISKWMTKEALQNHCKLTQMELDKQPVRCEVGIFSTEISQPTPPHSLSSSPMGILSIIY